MDYVHAVIYLFIYFDVLDPCKHGNCITMENGRYFCECQGGFTGQLHLFYPLNQQTTADPEFLKAFQITPNILHDSGEIWVCGKNSVETYFTFELSRNTQSWQCCQLCIAS